MALAKFHPSRTTRTPVAGNPSEEHLDICGRKYNGPNFCPVADMKCRINNVGRHIQFRSAILCQLMENEVNIFVGIKSEQTSR